eukprot:SAG11_NODE_5556_length_1526_cov_1.048353_1_plen_41_part_01
MQQRWAQVCTTGTGRTATGGTAAEGALRLGLHSRCALSVHL